MPFSTQKSLNQLITLRTPALARLDMDVYSTSQVNSLVAGVSGDLSNYVSKSATESISGTKTFVDDVIVSGDLTVSGTTTTINTQNTLIKDNEITLNYGEIGSGVTAGVAGIRIDRGSASDALIKWNDQESYFEIGLESGLGIMATRGYADGVANTAESNAATYAGGILTSHDESVNVHSNATNLVHTTGAESISGVKTFTNDILVTNKIDTAASLLNGVWYVSDGGVGNEIATEGYADAVYSDAASYADGVGTAANSYADGVASNAESNANSYTDTSFSNFIGQVNEFSATQDFTAGINVDNIKNYTGSTQAYLYSAGTNTFGNTSEATIINGTSVSIPQIELFTNHKNYRECYQWAKYGITERSFPIGTSSNSGSLVATTVALTYGTSGAEAFIRFGADTVGGYYTYRSSNTAVIPAAGKDMYLDAIIRLEGALSDATNEYIFSFGLGTSVSATAQTDAILFSYGSTTASPSANWQCVTMSSSSANANNNSGVVVAADTFYRLQIKITDLSEVKYYINGTLVQTHSANIPSGVGMYYIVKWNRVAGTGTSPRGNLIGCGAKEVYKNNSNILSVIPSGF